MRLHQNPRLVIVDALGSLGLGEWNHHRRQRVLGAAEHAAFALIASGDGVGRVGDADDASLLAFVAVERAGVVNAVLAIGLVATAPHYSRRPARHHAGRHAVVGDLRVILRVHSLVEHCSVKVVRLDASTTACRAFRRASGRALPRFSARRRIPEHAFSERKYL